MRHIGNLPNATQARVFHDYLHARGIGNEVEPDSGSAWMVWVRAEEQLGTARELLEKFQSNPTAPEFSRAAEVADAMRERQKLEEVAYQKRFFTRRHIFPGMGGFRSGVLTYGLIVACAVVGLFSKLGQDQSWLQYLFISDVQGGPFLPEVRAGEVWRLFTPMLIHFGPAHLLFNMLMLFQLGSMIESQQGSIRLAILVLSAAALSDFAQYAIHGPAFGGMSGVVYGLFGFIWVRGHMDPSSGLYIDRQRIVLMIVWFAAGFTGLMGPIANIAHGAGLIWGAACGLVTALLSKGRPR